MNSFSCLCSPTGFIQGSPGAVNQVLKIDHIIALDFRGKTLWERIIGGKVQVCLKLVVGVILLFLALIIVSAHQFSSGAAIGFIAAFVVIYLIASSALSYVYSFHHNCL